VKPPAVLEATSLWYEMVILRYQPVHTPAQSILHPVFSPEMEVTEIILAKASRLCQLSSHTIVGFFLGYRFFKFIGSSLWISLAQKTPSYDTKLILKVIFDKKKCLQNLRLVINLNKTLMKNN